jgi:hypothetical protein
VTIVLSSDPWERFVEARKHEIGIRYAWHAKRGGRGRRRGFNRSALALNQLRRLFQDRYGDGPLPENDLGRDALWITANHIARRPGDVVRHIWIWARQHCPWKPEDELAILIETVVAKPRYFSVDRIGKLLQVTQEERLRLRLTQIGAIGVPKRERRRHRRARARHREQVRREAHGARPRARSATRTKPWAVLGISERTWRRRGLHRG